MDKKIISKFKANGLLVSPSVIKRIDNVDEFLNFIKSKEEKPTVITDEIYNEFINKKNEKKKPIQLPKNFKSIKIIKNFMLNNEKIDINNWVSYYNSRYNKFKDLLMNRPELNGLVQISKIQKSDLKKVSIIGLVKDVHETSTGNIVAELEDPTGTIKVIFSKNKEIFRKAEEIVEDEVIGVTGSKRGNFLFAENFIFPDVPEREIKKSPHEGYAVFIADTHIGSKMFLEDEFNKFIKWISGEMGNEKQKEISKKVKYLFIVGDLVDGVGIYPNQEKELAITDIYEQYEVFAKYISKIPKDISIIICPGNHDAVKMSEPQPPLYEEFAKPLQKLPNVILVSNPSVVNIHSSPDFPGFDVLLYHGCSFNYYASNIPKLREGYKKPEIILEFLLRKRHLAPTHGSTRISPTKEDFLIIDKIPDIFASADLHKARIGKYKNILTLCCSCFQGRTSFQERMNHFPDPGYVPIVNLKTRETKMLKFS